MTAIPMITQNTANPTINARPIMQTQKSRRNFLRLKRHVVSVAVVNAIEVEEVVCLLYLWVIHAM